MKLFVLNHWEFWVCTTYWNIKIHYNNKQALTKKKDTIYCFILLYITYLLYIKYICALNSSQHCSAWLLSRELVPGRMVSLLMQQWIDQNQVIEIHSKILLISCEILFPSEILSRTMAWNDWVRTYGWQFCQ